MDFYLIIIVIIIFVVCHLAAHETKTLVHCGAKREIILSPGSFGSGKNVDIIFVFVEGKPLFRGKERFSWVPKPDFNLLSRHLGSFKRD